MGDEKDCASHDLVTKTLANQRNDSPDSLTTCSVGGVFSELLILDCSPSTFLIKNQFEIYMHTPKYPDEFDLC